MFGNHTPDSTRTVMGGVQHKFKFPNGFGASVVRHMGSYGSDQGLWELAVLGLDGHLTYDTPITSDVLGYLSEEMVADALTAVAELSPELIAETKAAAEREERLSRIAALEAELATLRAEVSA